MSVKTKIQWCDSTVNPTMGCQGCELWGSLRRTCYAGTLHVRFGGVTSGYAPTFEEVTLFPGRMAAAVKWSDLSGRERADKPWLNGSPRLIFISDMSDSLSQTVPFEYLQDEIIRQVSRPEGECHRWLWLTKRADRMATFSRWLQKQGIVWPWNLWAGTSITSQITRKRVGHLLNVGDDRTVHFLSVEPQVERVDLSKWLPRIDWVIQGGESGSYARPFDIDWAAELIANCAALGVPHFLKQLGSNVVRDVESLHFRDTHAGDWSEWPDHLRIRQIAHLRDA